MKSHKATEMIEGRALNEKARILLTVNPAVCYGYYYDPNNAHNERRRDQVLHRTCRSLGIL